MKSVFWVVFGLLVGQGNVSAQRLKKADKLLALQIAQDDQNLDKDTTELAQAGIRRVWQAGSFVRVTHVNEGRIMGGRCQLSLGGTSFLAGRDFFPLAGSPDGHVEGSSGVSLNEGGLPWIYDLKYDLETGKSDPGFDIRIKLSERVAEAKKKGATALLLYNSSKLPDALAFDGMDRKTVYAIPVIYINKATSAMAFKDPTAYVDVALTVDLEEKEYDLRSLEGFIDNGKGKTVVLEASLDSAGGSGALIALAKLVGQGALKKSNFLILGFLRGKEDLSLARCLLDQHALTKDSIDYIINIDRLGGMDPMIPELKVEAFYWKREKENIFAQVRDPYFQVVFSDSLDGHRPGDLVGVPRLNFSTTVTESLPAARNYNGEALAVRYIFKALEAADKK